MFNELGKGRLGVGVEKVMGITVAGALRSLSPEVSPVLQLPIPVEEIMGVSSIQRWCAGFVQAAVAGQSFVCKFRNPLGSGALIILETAVMSALAAGNYQVSAGYQDTADFATIPFHDFRDGRLRPRDKGAAVISHSTSTAQTPTSASWNGLASTQHQVPGLPYVLIPGNAVLFSFDTVNTAVHMTLAWRERGAPQAELAL